MLSEADCRPTPTLRRRVLTAVTVSVVLASASAFLTNGTSATSSSSNDTQLLAHRSTATIGCSGSSGLYDMGGIVSGPPGSIGAVMGKVGLHDRLICGANLYLTWARVEPRPPVDGVATYHWPGRGSEMARWQAVGKTVNLLVEGADEGTGRNTITPAWVLKATRQVDCEGANHEPVFWDPGYETQWKIFVAAVVSWANKQKDMGFIRFGIGEDAESLVSEAALGLRRCRNAWAAVGFPDDFRTFAAEMINYEATLGAKFKIEVALVNGVGEAANGKTSGMAALATLAVADHEMLEDNEMNATDAADVVAGHPCPAPNWCAILQQSANKGAPIDSEPNESTPAGGAAITGPLPALVSASVTGIRNIGAELMGISSNDWLIALDPSWPGASDTKCHGYATCGVAYLAILTLAATLVGSA
jgi:hypothetical protein